MNTRTDPEAPLYPHGHRTDPLKHKIIRILLVDASPDYRAQLRRCCEAERDLRVVGEAEDRLQAERLAGMVEPHVILVCAGPKENTGAETIHALQAICPQARSIIITESGQFEQAFPALNAGAQADLPRTVDAQALAQTIRAVYHGETLLNSQVAARIIQDLRASFTNKSVEATDP